MSDNRATTRGCCEGFDRLLQYVVHPARPHTAASRRASHDGPLLVASSEHLRCPTSSPSCEPFPEHGPSPEKALQLFSSDGKTCTLTRISYPSGGGRRSGSYYAKFATCSLRPCRLRDSDNILNILDLRRFRLPKHCPDRPLIYLGIQPLRCISAGSQLPARWKCHDSTGRWTDQA